MLDLKSHTNFHCVRFVYQGLELGKVLGEILCLCIRTFQRNRLRYIMCCDKRLLQNETIRIEKYRRH